MPEGPEIKRAAQRLEAAIAGQVAERVVFAFEDLVPFAAELEGRRVSAVQARGKALITRFEGTPLRIYSHNQLYGRWRLCAPERLPRTRRSLRLAIHTPHRWALLYSASDIRILLDDADEQAHPYLAKLGPDVLSPTLRSRQVTQRLNAIQFRRRQLASLYLDQSFLSGPGNYLRSEILFVAGLLPHRRPQDLSPVEKRRLSKASLEISQRAYAQRGVTVTPEIMRRLKAEGQRRGQYRHFVFSRDGRPCRRCQTLIEKRSLGGRRLYLCPGCQT